MNKFLFNTVLTVIGLTAAVALLYLVCAIVMLGFKLLGVS